MAAPASPNVLVGGPFHRNGKSQDLITDGTLRVVNAAKKSEWPAGPTYMNTKKAWHVLGYASRPKPDIEDFVRQVNNLWSFHQTTGEPKDRRAMAARAYMLDALRTLGFRAPHWNACHTENLHLHPSLASDAGQVYQQLRGPKDRIPPNQRAFNSTALLVQNPAPGASDEGGIWAEVAEMRKWREFHRYQGFTVEDPLSNESANKNKKLYRFRAIPVPRGPNSLWHSLAYWRGERRTGGRNNPESTDIPGSIMGHALVKARIWTFFMQTLRDSKAPRWRLYHQLQHDSTVRDGYYGEMSLARSLHASARQGLPAYCHQFILYVVADYFWCQIVVFHPPDGTLERPLRPENSGRAGASESGLHDPMCYQEEERYMYSTFGIYYQSEARAGNIRRRQIFLVTTDWREYDAVDFDDDAFWRAPGYQDPGGRGSRQVAWPIDRARSGERQMGFLTLHPRVDHLPFTALPPVGFMRNQSAAACYYDPDNQNLAPHQMTKFNFVDHTFPTPRPGQILSNYLIPYVDHVWGVYQPRPGLTLDAVLMDHFLEGIDIPGAGFAVPDDDTRAEWATETEDSEAPPFDHAEENWQWRFGKNTDETNILYLEDPVCEFLPAQHLAHAYI
ncbi:hypothetical protein B0H67DRAFT_101675 [Lasiosphaeris hirsuta]|uniref:Uncharacterized protein n=1 Tax=Lasiosphaeris hirsuta TaxID=260670 RepID=A0AA40E416_9PEZI|nr:hypothetical protein B0H67DRAFT_101675 [Lasiosphaeris hirsuta]